MFVQCSYDGPISSLLCEMYKFNALILCSPFISMSLPLFFAFILYLFCSSLSILFIILSHMIGKVYTGQMNVPRKREKKTTLTDGGGEVKETTMDLIIMTTAQATPTNNFKCSVRLNCYMCFLMKCIYTIISSFVLFCFFCSFLLSCFKENILFLLCLTL